MVLEYQKEIFEIEKFNDNFLKMKSFSEKVTLAAASLLFELEIPSSPSYHLNIKVFISNEDEPMVYQIIHDEMSYNVSHVLMRISDHLTEGKEFDLASILHQANIVTPDGISLSTDEIPLPEVKVFH